MKLLSFLAAITSLMVFGYFFIARPHRIAGDCMEPAVKDGSLRYVNHLYSYYNSYKTGDIIAFHYENKMWVSRIVALAGQEIMVSNKGLLLNGTPYDDGIQRDWSHYNHGSYGVDKAVKVPADSIYVLSDKLSSHHDDSRVFGPIAHKAIAGKIW